MSHTLYALIGSTRCSLAAQGLELAGIDYELKFLAPEELKTTLLPINPNGKVPTLVTPEGPVFESHAILRYAARAGAKGYGASNYENSQVDQWLDWTATTLGPLAPQFLYQLFGFEWPGLTYSKDVLFRAKNAFAQGLKIVDKALEGKKFLVGSELSIADIALLNAVVHYLTFFTGVKERKGLKNLVAWIENVATTAVFKKWYGVLRFTPTPYSFFKTEANAAAKKPQQKKQKKAQPVAKKAPKKPKYKFPETSFSLFDFKNFFVNEKDSTVALEKFWNDFDPKGWSLFHLDYIKYKNECEVVFKTNNLLEGFLKRAAHLGKHIFGTHVIIGDEPNLKIQAVWLIQGTEIFPDLKDHQQFDTYVWTKLDHTKAEDKALVNEFFALKPESEDGALVKGLPVQTFRWVK